MTWRDELRRVLIDQRLLVGASFRGVPFLVQSSDFSAGRRVVTHEFPFRDKSYSEDMGRGVTTFRVDGYVIGDAYIAKRDALIKASVETSGPGQLVHPYYGLRVVQAGQTQVREIAEDGGIAWISVEFTETPAQAPSPSIVTDPAGTVAAAADTANAGAEAEFSEGFDTFGLPSFALDSAIAAVAKASAAIGEFLGPIVTVAEELATLNGKIQVITARAGSLVRDPAELVPTFRDLITGLAETARAVPGGMLDALTDAYGASLGALVSALETTATRARERANQAAIIAALRRTMLIEASRLSPVAVFESTDDALATRDLLGGLLEEQALAAGDAAYPSLSDLRAQVLRAVPGERRFAVVNTVTRRVPVPSLLLAYQLYGSVANEADIIARNKIRHPGFVAGDLKVLSRDDA